MTELHLEITEILVYRTTVTVPDDIATRALAGDVTTEVNDAINEALEAHVVASDDWSGGTVEERTWEVADMLEEDDPHA